MKRIKAYTFFLITRVKVIICRILGKNLTCGLNSVLPLKTIVDTCENGKIVIGNHVNIRAHAKISAKREGCLIICNGVSLNYNSIICAYNMITIGENTIIGPNVCIYDQDHDYSCVGGLKRDRYKTEPIKIGKNVWIGSNVVILRGTTIGDNAVIGAGTVVKGNIPENTMLIQKRENTYRNIR